MITTTGRNRLESVASDYLEEEKKTDTRSLKMEEDFLFGLVTGKDEQEWSVIKFNKFLSFQKRKHFLFNR